jgi:type IV pilus assembly protein PilP
MAAPDAVGDISQTGNFLEPYIFDTREGRRNPFRPPVLVEQSTTEPIPGTPLERYEVDEIRLAGIMWDIRSPKAMFIDPTGAVHVIGKDDRIGRRQGYIATIRESEVVIVETTNFNGELAYATRILRIDKK